jgi:hypothetical protein
MNPSWPAFTFAVLIGAGEPTDLGCDTAALAKRSAEVGSDATTTADAVEEG